MLLRERATLRVWTHSSLRVQPVRRQLLLPRVGPTVFAGNCHTEWDIAEAASDMAEVGAEADMAEPAACHLMLLSPLVLETWVLGAQEWEEEG